MKRSEKRIISEKDQENSFESFVVMEDLLDKLKLLKYEEGFLDKLKIKPIHKYYFVIQTNPGEQFYLFCFLASWLIQKLGYNFEQPQESDDPNDTISKIIEAVKSNGIEVNFPPNKLKQGVGEQVVYILDELSNAVLFQTKFDWKRPKLLIEQEVEPEIIEDEAEINLERVEEEMIAAYSDDSDEENLFHIDDIKTQKKEILNYKINTDEEKWKLELEKVLPQLKVTVRNDSRDWRAHLEQMKNFKNNIDKSFGTTKTQLEKIHKDITLTMEKIGSREKYLNRELDSVLENYRRLLDELSTVKDKYSSISGGVAERNRELSKLTDKLETIKQQMEERGSSMTDGTPLVNIKKSVARVRAEIVDMDVRIGVLECILLQTKIRDEKQLENEFGQTISVY